MSAARSDQIGLTVLRRHGNGASLRQTEDAFGVLVNSSKCCPVAASGDLSKWDDHSLDPRKPVGRWPTNVSRRHKTRPPVRQPSVRMAPNRRRGANLKHFPSVYCAHKFVRRVVEAGGFPRRPTRRSSLSRAHHVRQFMGGARRVWWRGADRWSGCAGAVGGPDQRRAETRAEVPVEVLAVECGDVRPLELPLRMNDI